MALIEYDAYKQKLRDLKPELDKLSAALDVDAARQEAARLEDETAQDGFWNDLERSQKVQQRLKQLQNKIAKQEKLLSAWEDLTALCEMGQEADDPEILEELKGEYAALEDHAPLRRVRRMQRHFAVPRRGGRHRGPGLGPDALPHVHPLGGAEGLHV